MNADPGEFAIPMIERLKTPPPLLFHYTSTEGLLSIVESGRIRATHIKYLNDSSEVEWMWSIFLRQLRMRRDSAGDQGERERFTKIIETTERRPKLNEFVASFSEKGDDLSQWRSYCPAGSGFSIGFASPALRSQWVSNPAGGEAIWVGAQLLKVAYLNETDKADLDRQIDLLLSSAPDGEVIQGLDRPLSLEQLFFGVLSVIAPSFKHVAFHEEEEWRLILSKPHKPMPGQRFRAGKSSVIPYVEVELNRDAHSKPIVDYFISRVIVGPTPNPDLSIHSLKSLFSSQGHPEVVVEPSTVPYRHW